MPSTRQDGLDSRARPGPPRYGTILAEGQALAPRSLGAPNLDPSDVSP